MCVGGGAECIKQVDIHYAYTELSFSALNKKRTFEVKKVSER